MFSTDHAIDALAMIDVKFSHILWLWSDGSGMRVLNKCRSHWMARFALNARYPVREKKLSLRSFNTHIAYQTLLKFNKNCAIVKGKTNYASEMLLVHSVKKVKLLGDVESVEDVKIIYQ